ncbi:MAG: CRISPR-associated endonuclease Cas1 [Elusimicrobia bacterium]|nr:CRISPR-associated endonuclease Cas1 [Elusimicrobiota bacterium]
MPLSIPLRMLNEYVYCPRLFHLEFVQGLFRESADTVKGTYEHKKADANRPKVRRKNKEPESEAAEQPTFFTKNLSISSEKLGITGKLDAVEEEGGHWAPVESKHSGGPKDVAEFKHESWTLTGTAWPNDQVQICAQGILLRDSGLQSDFGYIFYRASKTKVRLDFTPDIMNATLDVIRRAQNAASSDVPPPLVDSPKCVRCSLNAFCLPDEINQLAGRIGEPRRIIPGRDDAGILYVVTQGARISKRGESVVVEANGQQVDEIPFKDIAHAALFGHVQISTEALHLFLAAQRTVSFLSAGGKLLGVAAAPIAKNVHLRVAQYRKFESDDLCLRLAKEIVQAKIENQRTLIRRNLKGATNELDDLKAVATESTRSGSLASLRGYEGKGGQIYFDAFPSLIGRKGDGASGQQTFDDLPDSQGWSSASAAFFHMSGRNKRPPRDPVNALLSFGYTLLTRDFVAALIGVGLDPYFGFYHAMEAGRPALALDLMEPFRPLIVDSLVLRLINTGEIRQNHFLCAEAEVLMSKDGRARFIAGYERRMDELITHPIFGYRISYRRILDVECRLLGRFLEGDIPEYKPLRTR